MTDWKKKILIVLLGCSTPLFACGPFFPATFIDEEDSKVHGDKSELLYHLSLLAEHFMRDAIPPSPRSAEQDPDTPRKEYELYEAGVKEITEDPDICFPEAWKELLQLPPNKRRYRTVRTLYMLGNLALRNKKDEAAAWKFYQDLRKAVRDGGFPDNLGLSRDTFNALRCYSSALGKLRYLPLAARFYDSNGEYREELERIVKSLSAEEREKALQDPYTAELLLLADPRHVRSAKHQFLLADRLAMRAYQTGNFTLCADLLKQTPDNSLIKLFLQARLARFKGDTQESARLLRKWLKLAETALKKSPDYAFLRGDEVSSDYHLSGIIRGQNRFGWKQEVCGLLGLVMIEENDFQVALLAFLKAGSWPDAALIAEQYMSTEALQKFIDSNNDLYLLPDRSLISKLRHLLARALLRQGKVEESVRYFPHKYHADMTEYAEKWKIFNSSADPEEQAKTLFRIAQIQLRYNIELFGYEFDPDFYICEGNYACHTPAKMRRTSILPRFHYRKTIAESFRRTAELTKSRELKFVSYLAAAWTLRNTDPAGADPFYKQLCSLKITPLSEFLIRRKWIPNYSHTWWREDFCRIKPEEKSLQAYLDSLASEWQAALPPETAEKSKEHSNLSKEQQQTVQNSSTSK